MIETKLLFVLTFLWAKRFYFISCQRGVDFSVLIVTSSLFHVSDGIISYTIPVDGSATDNAEIRDLSYDGVVSGDKFQGGLGRLVDGVRGGDNFKMDIGYGKGNLTNRPPNVWRRRLVTLSTWAEWIDSSHTRRTMELSLGPRYSDVWRGRRVKRSKTTTK